ncbi:MAG TPA: Y-family DNA polymerase [Spirochaetota bacterium]|nr:Y-family DNA polymerase [Spirochaetota bacterium]
MKRVYALVDCNNFYASCERVFNPSLRRRPVVILSNNDGCIVARSAEAKALGIPFASPYFKVRAMAEKHNTAVFSSNYALYADLSQRVMNVLRSFTPDVDVYSIDEAFLSLNKTGDMTGFGLAVKEKVYRWTGIPVSVGIGYTRTLAKAAAHIAKHDSLMKGALDLTSRPDAAELIARIAVRDIWGIGPAYAAKLNGIGVYTAADFIKLDPAWVKRSMTIMGLRTQTELKGRSCIEPDMVPAEKKAIVSSKSFGRSVRGLPELEQAVSTYAERAAEKLRRQEGLASMVTVFIMTNRFRDTPQYADSRSFELPEASCCTPVIIRCALALLRRLYVDGYEYNKAGIMLSGIVRRGDAQMNLFMPADWRGSSKVMETVDHVNRKYGTGTLFYASGGIDRPWGMRRELLSPAYTTRWEDIPLIRI